MVQATHITVQALGYMVVRDEDGEFHCPHSDVTFEYDNGGDGITEPGPSWIVYCDNCKNDDMSQAQSSELLEAYLESLSDEGDT